MSVYVAREVELCAVPYVYCLFMEVVGAIPAIHSKSSTDIEIILAVLYSIARVLLSYEPLRLRTRRIDCTSYFFRFGRSIVACFRLGQLSNSLLVLVSRQDSRLLDRRAFPLQHAGR